MIVVSRSAHNQVQDIISQFCDYKTPNEYGRSAFWLWIDKIHTEARSVSVRQSKKLKTDEYVYRMQFWGKIFFSARRIRINGKFAGTLITITEFQFDKENFYNWLQHEAPIEHKEPLPNVPDTRYKPKDIKLGFTKIKGKSELWAIADTNGNLISNDWFQDISYMRKTSNGEIATIVNKDGWAFAYYPQRSSNNKCIPFNKPYSNVVTEVIRLSELDLRYIISESIRKIFKEESIKVYKKMVVDNKGGEWPNFMSDQEIKIQNDYMRKNRITDPSQMLPTDLKNLSAELCGHNKHYQYTR